MTVGEVRWVELPARGGRAQAGRRPAIIVQGTRTLPTTLIVPGNSSSSANVDFLTGNNTYAPCNVISGAAIQNCDFIITSGTLTFGANEISKTFTIPLADDAYVEGNETLPHAELASRCNSRESIFSRADDHR